MITSFRSAAASAALVAAALATAALSFAMPAAALAPMPVPAAAVAAPVMPVNYFGGEAPIAIDLGRMPEFDAVGALFRKDAYDAVGGDITRLGQGTGTLIDACHVLTVRHVVADAATVSAGDRMVFATGGQGLPDRAVATPVAWGSVAVQGGTDGWVKLRLDRCLGETHGWLTLQPLPAATALSSYQGRLAVMGYSTGIAGPRRLHGDLSCSLRSLESTGNWRNDCAVARGFSGGPLLADFGGEWRIVGLVRGQNVVRGDVPVGAAASSGSGSPAYYQIPAYSDAWANVAVPMTTVMAGAN